MSVEPADFLIPWQNHPMVKRLLPLLALLLLTGCAAAAPLPDWTAADLRWLGSTDGPDPARDLTAVSVRIDADEIVFRIDLLDLTWEDPFPADLHIAIDASPGGTHLPFTAETRWDLLLSIPAGGPPRLTDLASGADLPAVPRALRDPGTETVTIRLARSALPGIFSFQVFTAAPGADRPEDSSPVLEGDGPAPAARAPLLLVFSQVLPAETPALALRAWDGAHSGPLRGRHGLSHLLTAARAAGVPLVLLDARAPSTLAALDALDQAGFVRNRVNEGLLLLPALAWAPPAEISLPLADAAALTRRIGLSEFAYTNGMGPAEGYDFQFTSLPDPTHLIRGIEHIYIPLPPEDPTAQPTSEGLSLDVRRRLQAIALSEDPADLLVLGGALPDSTWGDPEIVTAALAYISSRPWIQPLDAATLRAFPSVLGGSPAFPSERRDPLLSDLTAAPENLARADAWNAFLRLGQPAEAGLAAVQNALRGETIGPVLAAARWAADPGPVSDCSIDLTYDGKPECVLAAPPLFAVISTDGARLLALFAGERQIVGPSAQLIAGWSDPSEWDPYAGPGADPAQIMGAFVDSDSPFTPYTAALDVSRLTLTRADGARVKVFTLTSEGLQVDYQSGDAAFTTRLALVLQPTARVREGWADDYLRTALDDGWRWSLSDGPSVRVRASTPVSLTAFNDALELLLQPEDPNYPYPPGQYLPFGLAVAEIRVEGNLVVRLEVSGP